MGHGYSIRTFNLQVYDSHMLELSVLDVWSNRRMPSNISPWDVKSMNQVLQFFNSWKKTTTTTTENEKRQNDRSKKQHKKNKNTVWKGRRSKAVTTISSCICNWFRLK